MVFARFCQCFQVLESRLSPKLTRTDEAIWLAATGRLSRPAADRPASPGDLLAIHSLGLIGKILPLLGDGFAGLCGIKPAFQAGPSSVSPRAGSRWRLDLLTEGVGAQAP